MRLRIKVTSQVALLHLSLLLLFFYQYPFAQAGIGRVAFKVLSAESESTEVQSTNGVQKYTYVAKVVTDGQDEPETEEEDINEIDNNFYEKTEEITSGSAEESSSSEEIVKNRSRQLPEEQQGRLLRHRKSNEKSHNWYAFKDGYGRRIGDTESSKRDANGTFIKLSGPGSDTDQQSGDDNSQSGDNGQSWDSDQSNSGQINNGQSNNGHSNNGHSNNGQSSNGQRNNGQSKNGQSNNGQSSKRNRNNFSKPYKVRKAKPNDKVDPEGYNFFQFRPNSALGILWIGKKTIKHKGFNLGDDNGGDDGEPSSTDDWESRRYDRACLYTEYKQHKADAEIPTIPEELKRLVDSQNEQLARKFLDWQFNGKDEPDAIAVQDKAENHPLYRSYKFLQITTELFRDKICRNASSYAAASAAFAPIGGNSKNLAAADTADTKLLPTSFVEDIFLLFLTLREITLPKNIPDYATTLDEEEVFHEVLLKCLAEEPNITWFSHSCGDQVLSNDFPNNFACTPLVNYDFNSMLYDPILDGMWHMFNAVHSYCFKQFQRINTRLWHRYSMIIANTFTVQMRQRWKASVPSQKFYMRLLGPDHAVHLETMNRCMFGTVLRSNVPAILPRFDTLSPITFGKERMVHKDGKTIPDS